MQVSEIRSNVELLLGDSDNATISDAEILVFINSAYREICIETGGIPARVTFTNADITADGYLNLGVDLLQVASVTWNGKKLQMGNISLLEASNQDEVQSDSVTHWFYAGNQFIGFWPRPLEAISNTIKVRQSKIPSALTVDGDVPFLSVMYHEAIVYKTLAKCYERIDHPMKNDAEARYREVMNRAASLFEIERDTFPRVKTEDEGWTELWH